jgi:hypothetical protein
MKTSIWWPKEKPADLKNEEKMCCNISPIALILGFKPNRTAITGNAMLLILSGFGAGTDFQ